MANPIELTAVGPNGKTYGVWACTACEMTAASEQLATECCKPRLCECGTVVSRGWTKCDACRAERIAAEERKWLAAAHRVSWRDHLGPVCVGGDHFFASVDDLIDHYWGDAVTPTFAWACSVRKLRLDAHDVIDAALELQDHHEDARDAINDVDGLQRVLDEWCAGQVVESWFEDTSIAVVLDGAFEETER